MRHRYGGVGSCSPHAWAIVWKYKVLYAEMQRARAMSQLRSRGLNLRHLSPDRAVAALNSGWLDWTLCGLSQWLAAGQYGRRGGQRIGVGSDTALDDVTPSLLSGRRQLANNWRILGTPGDRGEEGLENTATC
jgi:hypothetical protein